MALGRIPCMPCASSIIMECGFEYGVILYFPVNNISPK
jgi:hypothetical protein